MITEKQLNKFLGTDQLLAPTAESLESGLAWLPPVAAQNLLNNKTWTSGRVELARSSLNKSIGVGQLMPPTEAEQKNRLSAWWTKEGQFIPRHVLDQLGVVGGEKIPNLRETVGLSSERRIGATKDFFGIERLKSDKDPLGHLIHRPDLEVADPSDIIFETKRPEIFDIIKTADVKDLKVARDTILESPLNFEQGLSNTIEDEIRIRETIPQVYKAMREKPLTTLLGTDFFNSIAFGLPEFVSRKGFSPTEALLGLPKGSESVWIRAVARVREQIAAQDPDLLTNIGLEAGNIAASLIKFAAIPDPGKARVFANLSAPIKAAIGVGTKAGLLELLKAPEIEETVEDRAKSIAAATGIGAVTGIVLSKLFTAAKSIFGKIKDLPVAKQADAILFKNPDLGMAKEELVSVLKHLKSTNPTQFKAAIEFVPRKVVPSKVVAARKLLPTGFRPGFAEIEKPAEIAKKAITKGVKVAIKAKEAAAIEAAKIALELKRQAAKAKPVKIITKKEALSLQESNLITGKGEDIRIVPDAKTRRLIQTKENEIAKLKTRREELKAEKQFAAAKTKAQEISKKEQAIVSLKEKAEIRLEQTIEGSKEKIAKIRAATEFKDTLRNDAISMITAIPKEIRPAFINRANKVKTLKGLQKLTDEIELGIEKFDRKIAVGELRSTIKDIESGNRLGKVRLGKIPSPQREKIAGIIDEISLKKISTGLPPEVKTFGELDVKARRGREQLLGADLKSLQQITQRLSSELAGGLETLSEDVEAALRIPDERVRQLNLLTQKNIAEIDTGDIKLVTQSLQQLTNNAKLKGKLLTAKGLKPLDGALKTITQDEIAFTSAARHKAAKIVKGKPVKVKKGVLKKAAEFGKRVLKLDDAHLDTLVQLSTNPGSKVLKQILDTDLHNGLNKSAQKLVGWIDASAERFEKIGFTDTNQISKEVEITLGGQKIKVEKDFLVKLELHSRSPDNLRAILTTKGWKIGDVEIDYPKDIDRLAELKEALEIVRQDSVLKGIADWTNELTASRAEAINEVSLTLNGYEIARDPTYTSRPRSLPRRVEGARDISVPPEQEGRYLPRTGGTARLKLEKWSDDFLSGLESDATLFGMAVPLRNARIVVSSESFQAGMKNAGRGLELQNIITILRRTQGVITSRSTLEVFGGRLQRGVTASALGFRVSTIGTQAMSYPAFLAEIKPIYGRPLIPVGNKYLTEMEKDSALLSLRWKGRRVSVEVGTSASFEAFGTLFFGEAKKISNRALKLLLVGDKQAFGNGHKAAVRAILSTPRNGRNVDVFEWDGDEIADLPPLTDNLEGPQNYPTSKKVRFAAMRKLEHAGRKTQPVFDMLDRSVSLSNPNILERQFFIFRTALEAQENIVIRATDAYAKSPKTLSDKKELVEDVGSVVISAFSVAVWKKGLKWAIKGGIAGTLAAFGIFTFDDRSQRENLKTEVIKDTGKNLLRLSKIGKFAVRIGELIADKVAGEGYNWNRNTFDLPVIDVLETGVDAITDFARVIDDAGLTDEFVEEITRADKEFNEQLEEKILSDAEKLIRSSFEFGVRITGQPFLAPVQEFLRPALVDSSIKIIREVTFGDVESPQKFSERVFALFELRKELNAKSKKTRLTRNEDQILETLNRFTQKANSQADILKETSDQKLRVLRFGLFESNLSNVENRIKFFEE